MTVWHMPHMQRWQRWQRRSWRRQRCGGGDGVGGDDGGEGRDGEGGGGDGVGGGDGGGGNEPYLEKTKSAGGAGGGSGGCYLCSFLATTAGGFGWWEHRRSDRMFRGKLGLVVVPVHLTLEGRIAASAIPPVLHRFTVRLHSVGCFAFLGNPGWWQFGIASSILLSMGVKFL